jgi:acyl-CoA reductase-like NAD-dependent aldehyde dehydrogenase
MTTPQLGGIWDGASLIWGRESGSGEVETAHSPGGVPTQSFRPLDQQEIARLFVNAPSPAPIHLAPLQDRLVDRLLEQKWLLTESIAQSTGFLDDDVCDVFEGLIEFSKRFSAPGIESESALESHGRRIDLAHVPIGTVAAILPQNAFEILALTCTLNALAMGNRIVLRAPRACARSAAILGRILLSAGFPPERFSMVLCDAKAFIDAALTSDVRPLIHYMGGSGRASDLLGRAFQSRSTCLIDGDGNTHVYVDRDQDPEAAAKILWKGALRFNGQTCTSIVGATVHPEIDRKVRDQLRSAAAQSGPPRRLFSQAQADAACESIRLSKGRVGKVGNQMGTTFPPTLVEDPEQTSSLVTEGVFAPVLWVRTGDFNDFAATWSQNRFPLCAGLMSHSISPTAALDSLPGVARLVVNGDPSIEDVLEPWGGYPGSGNHAVSGWHQKYLRTVQVDLPISV